MIEIAKYWLKMTIILLALEAVVFIVLPVYLGHELHSAYALVLGYVAGLVAGIFYGTETLQSE